MLGRLAEHPPAILPRGMRDVRDDKQRQFHEQLLTFWRFDLMARPDLLRVSVIPLKALARSENSVDVANHDSVYTG